MKSCIIKLEFLKSVYTHYRYFYKLLAIVNDVDIIIGYFTFNYIC